MSDRLAHGWMALATAWGASGELAGAIHREILGAYGEPGRFYHTMEHIAAVLDTIERFGPGDDPAALALAAWYHDIIYDTRASDNEERSAGRAGADLRRLGAPEELVGRVACLVLATKDHTVAPGDRDGRLFLDADLAILGAPPPRYEEYSAAIGLEYGWVTPSLYRAGRIGVLESFLTRERIYLTEPMFERFEATARSNIGAELLRLRDATAA